MKKKLLLSLIILSTIILTSCYQVTYHKITIDVDGGFYDISEIDIKDGTRFIDINLKEPTKEGHTFKGWMINNRLIEDETSLYISEPITIKAKWEENSYNLTLTLKEDILYTEEIEDATYVFNIGSEEITSDVPYIKISEFPVYVKVKTIINGISSKYSDEKLLTKLEKIETNILNINLNSSLLVNHYVLKNNIGSYLILDEDLLKVDNSKYTLINNNVIFNNVVESKTYYIFEDNNLSKLTIKVSDDDKPNVININTYFNQNEDINIYIDSFDYEVKFNDLIEGEYTYTNNILKINKDYINQLFDSNRESFIFAVNFIKDNKTVVQTIHIYLK